ncbi:LuxR family transcriptional regulator [Pseudorhodobacter sp.]|uniref:helix-turn-helix transcriptional regulator n=1 Tax=Pseudorhodobacter sp. TaxID=1934400 RepID=UPI002649ECAA|nr:LuxR family transcriptional regulator [Pseudorhodobacter sp.]MDN5787878.1 LuxR family transcriptional regulator [Pseudorhodobacter sp.]
MALTTLAAMGQAENAATVWQHFALHLAKMGFPRCFYGLTRFRFEQASGEPADAFHFAAGMDDRLQSYLRSAEFAANPMYRWMLENTGACTWGWIDVARRADQLSATEIAALKQSTHLGLGAGVGIRFAETCHRIKGAIGLFAHITTPHAEVDRLWRAHESEITALTHMMHLKIASLPLSPVISLTKRQREALEWVADGKTMQDIAVLMGVSSATVEKHLRLAREALNVGTTAQAVARATLAHTIFTRNKLD